MADCIICICPVLEFPVVKLLALLVSTLQVLTFQICSIIKENLKMNSVHGKQSVSILVLA